jgi:GT2 family glycosyltransferase
VNNQLPGYLPSCLLVWQETFRRIGRFDPALWAAYDIDWFLRANDAGVAAALVPEVLVHYRVHETNQSRNVFINQQNILRAIRMNVLRRRNSARSMAEPDTIQSARRY